jgi:putative sigma-54 modulation protein
MEITIQSVNFDADQRLLDFIREKVSKLHQFFDRIVTIQVFLHVEKNTEKGNKLVEMKVLVPQETLVASQRSVTFESAFDLLIDQMSRQVKKYKSKMRDRK